METTILSGKIDFEKIFNEIKEIVEKNFQVEKVEMTTEPYFGGGEKLLIYTFTISRYSEIVIEIIDSMKYLEEEKRFISIIYKTPGSKVSKITMGTKKSFIDFLELVKKIEEFMKTSV